MSHPILSGRTRALQACGCGCGQAAPGPRLHPIKTPARTAHVLDPCRGPFAREIDAGRELRALVAATRATFFVARWRRAPRLFRLQSLLHTRLRGPRIARRAAWRTTLLFCLPQRLGRWLARRPSSPLTSPRPSL